VGLASNQWLGRGQGVRYRPNNPVPVRIESSLGPEDDDWAKSNGVEFQLTAYNKEGEYQEFLLTRPEAEQCAAAILDACSSRVRQRLAIQLLREMSAAHLLKSLVSVLRSRLREPRSK
jgi:hypothetical protein